MPAPAATAATPFADDETGQRITLHGQALPLTRREYRLLSAPAARRRPHPFARRPAGRRLGDDSESTDRTVDTHIKTLRAKLREVDAGREYISTHRAWATALMFTGR